MDIMQFKTKTDYSNKTVSSNKIDEFKQIKTLKEVAVNPNEKSQISLYKAIEVQKLTGNQPMLNLILC